uniref:ankyrin repeat domain-containing protein 31 n=1 Tax=Ictidomys tridecemlineatus TaxID=43179 RepID=UPI001A9EF764|nr:ankyrin repeat domain-containing protein 31 [Ictidomys tridecemlineatus]
MEEGVQSLDSDSDETVIEGSVTESDFEDDELPWRRLFFDQDTSLRSEFSVHPGISGLFQGIPSPEIQLGHKLSEGLQEQMNENKMMTVLSADAVLQQPQDEIVQNQAVSQTRKNFPMFTVSFPQPVLSLNHQNIEEPEAENTEVLSHLEEELSENRDSPEISLLAGTAITVSGRLAVKEKSLTEQEKILAVPHAFSEPGEEVSMTMTSKETKDEESSLETFVSALERLLTSPDSTQEERLLEIMNDFDPGELINSQSSIEIPLNASSAYSRDFLENTKDDTLPAELLAALNTLSETKLGPICHRTEEGSNLSDENGCLEVEPVMSQTDEDGTQIAETVEDLSSFELPTLPHQNVPSCEPLNNKGNSNSMENASDQETPRILRRSSRLEKLKVSRDANSTNDICKITEEILPKIPSCEDQINNKSSTNNFRMQDPVLMIEGKGKRIHSSRLKSKQIRKNKRLSIKNEKMKMNKLRLSNINRKNIFGENLLYKAALHNDADLIHLCIKKGANVNQPSYAGWTALHEASLKGFYRTASELLKSGADVNIKGMNQITPLHDAVINGHYKVAELLLLNGADPLFRSTEGKCALEEAKDSCMKRLLERHVPKHQRCLISARRNSTDPADLDDVQQHKKPKLSSENHIGFVCNENSDKQKPEHVEVNKRSKENLFLSEEHIYEHYQKDTKPTKFGNSRRKKSTVDQIHSTGLSKVSLHKDKGISTNVSKGKGRRNTLHKRTHVDDGDCLSEQTIAVSSSRRINRVAIPQQHILQTPNDLPEESCEPSSPTLSSLKNALDNNIETYSVSKEIHTPSLDLSNSPEMHFLELQSTGQPETISFSGLRVCKEIKLPLVTEDQQLHAHQEQHCSPYKFHEYINSNKNKERFNKWENSFLTFLKENFDNDNDCYTSEKTVTSEKVICSKECKSHCNCEENLTNRKEMDFQQLLLSEDHFSQEKALNSLTTLQQEEVIHFSDSDSIVISDKHIANHVQCMYGASFDHSHGNPEQTSKAYTRTLSIHEVSKVTSHVELVEKPQDNSPREPTPLMNQTEKHIVERVCIEKKQDTKGNDTKKCQITSSSNKPFPTVDHSQGVQITKVEKKRQDLTESEPMHNIDFHSTDNMNKEMNIISQSINQVEEKKNPHKSDEELTNDINVDERAIRNCEDEKEKMNTETYMSPNIQEHKKGQNFRNRQNFLKVTYNQEMKTAGINKRNVRGQSRLHLAARRGNLSLVKVLIESGADVNLKDNAGWTPLHEASNEGFNDIIVELLKAGANVNCENIDGILPLHDAVASNHLKAAEILLQHGANPNQKDQKQKTALDEADNDKMKELLKSHGAIEANNRDESNATVTAEIPAVRTKRHKQCFCDVDKNVDPSSLSRQEKTRESLPVHETISAILQDIEEKQENLLVFEIRNPEDAEQYIEKMLEIKEIMDNVLAKQKAERDDLAKKYRVSIESFKHGALREQLANLATRQKSLLVVAKKQKKISLKIQNYKNVTSLSDPSLRKLPSSSHIFSEKDNKELTSLENSVQPHSGSLSHINIACRSIQETPLSLETCHDSHNTNLCLASEAVRREEFSGIEMNSKQNVNDCTLDGLFKSRYPDSSDNKLSSQPDAFIAHTEYSQKDNDHTETTAKDCGLYSPFAITGTLNGSKHTSILSQKNAHPSAVIWDQDLSQYDPKRGNRKTASQQPPGGTSESWAQQAVAVLGTDTVHQTKQYLEKTASAVPHINNSQVSSSSGSGHQHTIKKPLNYSTTPKKKCMQIKDLILLGRMNPGNNILEFKTQETIHKASVLLSGKIKVENGQIYQNPVTWLKDLLGGDSYVTWNYAWSKVTYLGKELLKYVSEEVPPEPNVVPQQHQPCLPGTSRESVQNIPHHLQINEILLINDQEFLPCHIMDQHWKFYVECEELTF